MAYFRKSTELTVYIKINTAVCTFKAECAGQSVSLVVVSFIINTNRIFIRYKRRCIGNWIIYICVLGLVITMKLPVRRNRNFFAGLQNLCGKFNFCKIIR